MPLKASTSVHAFTDKNVAFCCFSPSSGLSIYIDGVLVGSQAKFEHTHYTAGSMHPLCIGSCAAAGHNTNHNITLSRMLFVGASVQDLRRNNFLDLLGGHFHFQFSYY